MESTFIAVSQHNKVDFLFPALFPTTRREKCQL
jgi:hypothetical protein